MSWRGGGGGGGGRGGRGGFGGGGRGGFGGGRGGRGGGGFRVRNKLNLLPLNHLAQGTTLRWVKVLQSIL
jgi:hypothetical protein